MGSVASVKTLEDVKSDPHCLYIAMPVQVRLLILLQRGRLMCSNSKLWEGSSNSLKFLLLDLRPLGRLSRNGELRGDYLLDLLMMLRVLGLLRGLID